MTSRNRKDHDHYSLNTAPLSLTGRLNTTQLGNGASAEMHTEQLTEQEAGMGKIEVSPRAISHLASRAAQRSYGVVGLAARNARPGWAELLRRDEVYKGVDVTINDGQVIIDLYVVLEYGTRISEVARNIMSNSKFAVETALGVPVVQVNVNVQGIRVSK
ncbi:MAG: Asp23/Gls24 family envelope stress response protein [Chloroflexota bacterium]|nr:Asp23/Gls24 family envelope stress response protein [Chloroflexota bacterium]MDQ5867054.1 Asp23/Gls24 family envelope stress response protein [Chloroflexota bacterium]